MNYNFAHFVEEATAKHSTSFFISNIVAGISVFAILLAVLIDFMLYHRPQTAKKKLKSPVETGSMFLFFFIYCVLLNANTGKIVIENLTIEAVLTISGAVLVFLGSLVNVLGRLRLKDNWANQVTIYEHQMLVTTGVYRFARHPLYASIIWMLLGGCLIYLNYLALASVVFVFIPMMIYRARQEEKFLLLEFQEYADYRKRVWMFSPKMF